MIIVCSVSVGCIEGDACDSAQEGRFLRWLWVADATSHGPSHVYGASGSSSCRATVERTRTARAR